jgi:ABC-type multidrug transport system ATPase subunit
MGEVGMDHDATSNSIRCPYCFQFTALDAETCIAKGCGLPLARILQVEKGKTTLTRLAAESPELRVDATWPGGESRAQTCKGHCELLVRDQKAVVDVIDWASGSTSKSVLARVRHCGVVKSLKLPGQFNLGDVRFRVRMRHHDKAPLELHSPYLPAKAVAKVGAFVLGASADKKHCDLTVVGKGVETQHCLIVCASNDREQNWWVVDLGSETGTFVNGQSILAHRLQGGDLIQVGHYAWQFSASDGFIVPVGPVDGVTLHLKDVAVPERLESVDLTFQPRQLVALVGPSGAGKSTLVRTIIDNKKPAEGSVLADGLDIHDSQLRDRFRSRLGYVPQKQVIHEHLTARKIVEFAGRFRGSNVSDDLTQQIEDILREVDLPKIKKSWDRPVKQLSGGEWRRVQIAAELVNEPAVFILDEPTTGLDPDREELVVRLLHNLSRRGATVLAVTHSRQRESFDREVRIESHKVVSDETRVTPQLPHDESSPNEPGSDVDKPQQTAVSSLRQAWLHFSREWHVSCGERVGRLFLPLFIVPIFFALSVHWSVEQSGFDLKFLGFLSVLSCIWMGSSLALLSIVGERRIIEHERRIFLNVAPYISAKTCWLLGCSLIQTGAFFGIIWWLRERTNNVDDMLHRPGWCFFCLLLVGWAAVGMGMLISATSRFSSLTASFILPLVMMIQIVFSVEIAGNRHSNVQKAYSEFSRSKIHQSKAVAFSYGTISRHGDMALRSFAYDRKSAKQYRQYFWCGAAWLMAWVAFAPTLAGLIIWRWPLDYESDSAPFLAKLRR